jgi:uncharacterized protein YwgA
MTDRFTTILELLRCTKMKVGKTFIQKAIYVLQNWLGWDSDYKFKLHYYGPYSQDLSDDLDTLSELGFIKMVFNGNSYDIRITDDGVRFLDENLEAHMPNKTKIERAISLIGKGDVKNMELIGTILYFAKLAKNDSEIIELVNTVKPHFPAETINGSIEYLKTEGVLSS